ncbi:Holliday junction resolvase RecU [Periweissella cryptocerci]|uniref:Holliday junction resolvase RecU n=1 Tax=Periweissella cryptocerci TaxID=2506420 RepID=A0A4P6YS35_9LACO|nr:Holliday junction resolvase RecU [Periweissella cryptocerci]
MIHYPNGSSFQQGKLATKKGAVKPVTNYGKRGMTLEEELNQANQYYQTKGLAVIHKKPTPVKIVNVNYPARSAAKITEAYFSQASTTDYNGIYRGHYVDFDAKETKNKTSIPLDNFHEHQIAHLKAITEQGGIGFVVIRFVVQDEVFVYPANRLIAYWQNKATGGRKSIPYAEIHDHGFRVPTQLNPTVPYLAAVDQLIAQLP